MKKQRGVGLVEVLVAVLVLAVGFLGMAGLQTRGLKAAQSSYERSMANIYAYSMLDAIRANAKRTDDVAEQRTRAQAYDTGGDWLCTVPAAAAGSLVSADLNVWMADLRARVRGDACGRITEVDNSTLEYRIEVCWSDLGGGSDTANDNCVGGEQATTLMIESRL